MLPPPFSLTEFHLKRRPAKGKTIPSNISARETREPCERKNNPSSEIPLESSSINLFRVVRVFRGLSPLFFKNSRSFDRIKRFDICSPVPACREFTVRHFLRG